MEAVKRKDRGSASRATRVLTLPYPPSVNHYWRRVGARTLISREGRRYRTDVCALLAAGGGAPLRGRLAVRIEVRPPDRRRRDLDNVQKAVFDSLQHAGVYEDDWQIDRIEVQRGPVVEGGSVVVEIVEVAA